MALPQMAEASTSRVYTPTPEEDRLRDKLRRSGSQLKAKATKNRPSNEWRRSLREDETGELHDPEYRPFRHAQPEKKGSSSGASSVSSLEAGGNDAATTSRSYYGRSMQMPGLPQGVTAGLMPPTASSRRQSFRNVNGINGNGAASFRGPSTYLAPERETLYRGTIAADETYNPYTYRFSHKQEPRRYDLATPRVPSLSSPARPVSPSIGSRSPRPDVASSRRTAPVAPSIAESETSELLFQSEYIPTLNQPTRHRQTRIPMTSRDQEDSFEAGCYKLKRAFQATKLDVKFAVVRLKRKTGMS